MTEPRFTPGPWKRHGGDVNTADDWLLAVVYGVTGPDKDDPDVRRANIHLIAAAPELYEELSLAAQKQAEAVGIMVKHGFKFETPLHLSEGFEKLAFTFYTMLCEVRAHAESALAKARGEE